MNPKDMLTWQQNLIVALMLITVLTLVTVGLVVSREVRELRKAAETLQIRAEQMHVEP